MEDLEALTAVLARAESEFRKLEGRQKDLEKKRAGIIRKIEAANGDAETLAQLNIEIEQVAEAKREIDQLMAEPKKQLETLEQTIAMQRQSDMT